MDELDRAIVDRLQTGFPVCERPFLEAARALGTTEDKLIAVHVQLQKTLFLQLLEQLGQ